MEEKINHSTEEIDLFYFFKPVVNVGRKIGTGIKRYIASLKRNRLLFLLIVLLVSGGGYMLRYIMHKAYRTNGIFVSHVLPNHYCQLMLENLNEVLRDQDNIDFISGKLKIAPEVIKQIVSIKLTSLNDTFALEAKDTTLSLFNLTLVVRNMQFLDSIQKGIINYLENSEYAVRRKDAKIKSLQALKISLGIKIQSLDSLKTVVNSSIVPRSQGAGIILGEPINPVSIYQAEAAYYQQQLKIDEELATIDNIEVVQPFLRRSSYNYPDFRALFLYSVIASFVLSLLFTPLLGRK